MGQILYLLVRGTVFEYIWWKHFLDFTLRTHIKGTFNDFRQPGLDI
jgi:hypothetical protein